MDDLSAVCPEPGIDPGAKSVGTQAASQSVFVNHLFAVVDEETARAMEASALLRECSDFTVQRIEADGGECWTGRYVMMRTTYLELFGPHDSDEPLVPGSIGIALGGDRPGVVDAIDRRLRALGVKTETKTRKRLLAGEEVDWFRYVGPAAVATTPDVATVDVWLMEYLASYVDRPAVAKRASLGPADTVSRLRYNAGSYRDGLFGDLSAAHFAIDEAAFAARVKPCLTASGFRVVEHDDGAVAHSDEADLQFTFVPLAEAGLRELRFRLSRHVVDERREAIGRSMLRVGPGTEAAWTFAA